MTDRSADRQATLGDFNDGEPSSEGEAARSPGRDADLERLQDTVDKLTDIVENNVDNVDILYDFLGRILANNDGYDGARGEHPSDGAALPSTRGFE